MPAATIPTANITISVVERDMWDHYNTGNKKYREAVQHLAIGWERSGLIQKGSAGGQQPLKPDVSLLTFPPAQRERRATLMALTSRMDAEMGAVEEHNQELPKRMRAVTLPLSAGTNLSPSKSTVRKWVRDAKIDDEESSSDSNSEAEDGEPDWTQVNASKGYRSAAYFVRRDHRKSKAVRQREKAELAKAKAAKIVERVQRAIAAQKAYDEHNEKFPTRPRSRTSTVTRRLTYKAKVEHVEDVAAADDASEVSNVATTFAKDTTSSELVKFSDSVVNENTTLLKYVSILKSKTKGNNENKEPKTPTLQHIIVSTTSQSFATAYTAQTCINTSGASMSTSSDRKGKRKATPAENQLIETERSVYGWYAPPYLPQDRARR